MRLTTIHHENGTAAARLDGDELVVLPFVGLASLLAHPDWHRAAMGYGPRLPASRAELARVVEPAKTLCVGLNYRSHITESGRPVPSHPTLFGKFTDTLIGPTDDIELPPESGEVDWEVELGVVIGAIARNVSSARALDCIAGYTVVNDVSMRDWQSRTTQWLQGKNFEATTPVGPFVVTGDEVDDAGDLRITCSIDDEIVQDGRTSDLLFGPAELVSYVSRFTTLRPGDLIATGTPGGVGAARQPKRFLRPGEVLRSEIEGIGAMSNTLVAVDRTAVRGTA
jgi:acylpyruvate hydrolase